MNLMLIERKLFGKIFGFLNYFLYISTMGKLTILTQLSDIERDLKRRCEWSTNDMEGDKWSKHHDNILSLIKDLSNG